MRHVYTLPFRPLAACIALLIAGGSSLAAQPLPPVSASPAEAYSRAVAEYVKAADGELNALRTEIKNHQKAGAKKDFTAVKEQLEVCAQLVEQLRKAAPSSFDTTKSDYERERAELIRLLTKIRTG